VQLHRTVDFGIPESRTMLVVGEVVLVHCADGVRSGHRIDHLRFTRWGALPAAAIARPGTRCMSEAAAFAAFAAPQA